MISDLRQLRLEQRKGASYKVDIGDARSLKLEDNSVDFVITSPPYLNRDNYIAQSKLELFLLDFVLDMEGYRKLTRSTLRSHVEADYVTETKLYMHEVDTLVNEIKKRPLNNPKIPDMIEGYFEDMNIVFGELYRCVRRGGLISIIVGNSAWSGILVETDKILAQIAGIHGFDVRNIFITRYKLNSAQQISKYGKMPIRESVIIASKR